MYETMLRLTAVETRTKYSKFQPLEKMAHVCSLPLMNAIGWRKWILSHSSCFSHNYLWSLIRSYKYRSTVRRHSLATLRSWKWLWVTMMAVFWSNRMIRLGYLSHILCLVFFTMCLKWIWTFWPILGIFLVTWLFYKHCSPFSKLVVII